ncbi:conserved hypothetical protein [Theileria equi strain WA]|uniref:Uncharacterized protein n=1 Tax=Theileria equi strain WA TaxID=1537102 RepID=L1LCG8_THEEQ|nr:conserved hypothetical protein [Theileria equi strain WA]EKX72974.1 conserved hypothetical protein [Theileria equi strain WA]|eukprot:XP_004832426.1 conserved hypothetical protein [Theileria equi strain WA]
MRVWYIVCASVITFLAQISGVYGWNELCREAIESTAMSAITYMRLRRLKVILKGSDLVDYTWWGDEVLKRIPESYPLHYQFQTDTTCSSYNFTCENGLCLVSGVRYFFYLLMNAGYAINDSTQPNFQQPEFKYPKDIKFSPSDCLKYLVVLISDLHHPLHLDFKGADSIGNLPVDLTDFPVWKEMAMEILGTYAPSLSAFIREVYMPEYIRMNENAWYGSWTHVATLGSRYTTELELFNRKLTDTFEVWAVETASLNCSTLFSRDDVVPMNSIPGFTHAIKFTQELDERLGYLLRFQIVLAGARIAIVINYILTHREISYNEKTGLLIEKDPAKEFTWETLLFCFLFLIFLSFLVALIVVFVVVSRMLYKQCLEEKFRNFFAKFKRPRSHRYSPINRLPE